MKPCIIIPARYSSTRYPGKPLVKLKGRDGSKTLIQRVWERGCQVLPPSDVYVATDDERIKQHVETFGGQVLLTSESCRNGTERCAEAIKLLKGYDLVVNLQGDAPLTPVDFLQALISEIDSAEVATPILKLDEEGYNRFIEDRKMGRVGGTTVVFAQDKSALYFSKEVVPYLADSSKLKKTPVFHHVGAYAYRPSALEKYISLKPTPYELSEGLEQLRFIENHISLRCIEVVSNGRVFWELNNPIDVERIERELR